MCKRYMQNNENKIDILISKKKKVTRHKEYRKAKYIKNLATQHTQIKQGTKSKRQAYCTSYLYKHEQKYTSKNTH